MKRKTNLLCVNSGYEGECKALIKPHKLCSTFDCPFYITAREFNARESKARERCRKLGIDFMSRDQVMDDMYRISVIQKRRYEKEKVNGRAKNVHQEDR